MAFKGYSFILIGICIVVFLVQGVFPAITDEFALVSADVQTRPWILVTSVFLHGGVLHLLYNMFALGLFGFILEKIIGGNNFLAVFLITGFLASLGSTPFYEAALGASGAIFGILGALTALRPKMVVFIGYIPMPMMFAAFFWAVGDLLGILVPSNVANIAHLVGLGAGLLIGIYLKRDFGEEVMRKKSKGISDDEFQAWEKRYM